MGVRGVAEKGYENPTLTLTLTITLTLTGLGSPQAFPSDLGPGLLTLTEIVKGFENDMISSEIKK